VRDIILLVVAIVVVLIGVNIADYIHLRLNVLKYHLVKITGIKILNFIETGCVCDINQKLKSYQFKNLIQSDVIKFH